MATYAPARKLVNREKHEWRFIITRHGRDKYIRIYRPFYYCRVQINQNPTNLYLYHYTVKYFLKVWIRKQNNIGNVIKLNYGDVFICFDHRYQSATFRYYGTPPPLEKVSVV